MSDAEEFGGEAQHEEADGWQVTAIVPSDTSTSGEAAKLFSVEEADSAEEAEEIVKRKPGVRRVEHGLTIPFVYDDDGRMVT